MVDEHGSGLDLDLQDVCSRCAFDWARRTFANRTGNDGETPVELAGAFSHVVRIGRTRVAISSDGIGTKIELAERIARYDTLGFDLIAMVVDDLVTIGAEATNVSNILDVDRLDRAVVNDLMRGLHNAAAEAGVSITGGEIAELGPRIYGFGSGMHFNWCATAIGILPDGRDLIDGRSISPGDTVVALQSRGFRSNGFSLIRRVLTRAFGEQWHTVRYDDSSTWSEHLLTPSRIYCRALQQVWGAGIQLHGIVHVTGGGIPGNLPRVLRAKGLGATLDSLFPPLPWMSELQALGKIDEMEAYRYWNMGNGMLLISTPEDTEGIVEILTEQQIPAQRVGVITTRPELIVRTRGARPQEVRFPLGENTSDHASGEGNRR